MDAPAIHSLLAAALVDPERLARWRAGEGAPEGLDVEALWRFAGLSERVRYNVCETALPLTFRLLHLTGLAVEVFALFAPDAAVLRRAGRNGVQEKVAALATFLEGWVEPSQPTHALLLTTLRHELALGELHGRVTRARASAEQAVSPGGTVRSATATTPTDAWVPSVEGEILLREMPADPRRVTTELRRATPQIEAIPLQPIALGYWWDRRSDRIHLVDLDGLGFFLLAAADGGTPVAAIAARLGWDGDGAALVDRYMELVEVGLVTLKPPGRTQCG